MTQSKHDIVVKSNRLITAFQKLTLSEIRLIQLAIVDARESGNGLHTDKPLRIDALRYAEAFGLTKQTAYKLLTEAEDRLFERKFTFIDQDDGKPVKSRWVQRAKYLNNEGGIEIIFTYDVINEISRIDGFEQFFTSYLLEQTALLNSVYSVRLYELLIQWKSVGKTPTFEIDQFRAQLGVAVNEYPAMGNFKRRVLDLAVNEVNEKTNIIVEYDQLKTGKTITGFRFKFKLKSKNDNPVQDENKEYLICNLTDSQIITFSDKLAKHEGFKKFGNRGEEDNNFIKRIQLMLRKMDLDIELSKRITPYLKELDFKPTSKNLVSLDDLIYKINENNKSNNNFKNDNEIKDKENELILNQPEHNPIPMSLTGLNKNKNEDKPKTLKQLASIVTQKIVEYDLKDRYIQTGENWLQAMKRIQQEITTLDHAEIWKSKLEEQGVVF